MTKYVKYWNEIVSLEDAFYLIDIGVVIRVEDLVHLKRSITHEMTLSVFEYFAKKLTERHRDRVPGEVIMESMLLWMSMAMQEAYFIVFLQKIFEHAERDSIIYMLPRLCFGLEIVDSRHEDNVYDLSVFLVAQTGIQIKHFSQKYPEEFPQAQKIVNHISAIMVSIANVSSYRARLCLVNYFGMIELEQYRESYFNRVMTRFGSTVLNQLFSYLFEKKTEAYAYQYFVENFPCILLTDSDTQSTIQEIMRYNMLKHPEKFSQLIREFTPELKQTIALYSSDQKKCVVKNYLHHLATLLQVVSQIGHPKISKELLLALCSFEEMPFTQQFLDNIIQSQEIRSFYRKILYNLRLKKNKKREYIESIAKLRTKKRGRRPRISKKDLSVFEQIFFSQSKNAKTESRKQAA